MERPDPGVETVAADREALARRFEDHYCEKHDFYFCPLDYDHTPHQRTQY